MAPITLVAAAAKSGRQTIYKSGQNTTIEVGPGNLKLIYTANDGKLARYINTRTSVCHLI